MNYEKYTNKFYRIGEATEDTHKIDLLRDIVEELVAEVSTLENRVAELETNYVNKIISVEVDYE